MLLEPAVVPSAVRVRTSSAHRLLRQNGLLIASVGFLVLVAVVTVVCPLLPLHDPNTSYASHTFQGPSGAFPLGTDDLGRDILSRLAYGARVTLLGVLEALLPDVLIGVPLGLASGFFGGVVDSVVMWFADLAFATPTIVVVLAILAIIGNNQAVAMVAMGVLGSFALARLLRGATMVVSQEQYVSAAFVSGLPRHRVIMRHVFPRIGGTIVVQASLFASVALLFETGLQFLGFATHPPAPSWGSMIAESSQFIVTDPWMIIPPGAVIAITIVALGLLGDGLRDMYADSWSRTSSLTRPAKLQQPPTPVHGQESVVDQGAPVESLGALLDVRSLSVTLVGGKMLVENITFQVKAGETLGIVGESGCGKSTVVSALLGLLPTGVHLDRGEVYFGDKLWRSEGGADLQDVRGSRVGLISQQSAGSLDPNFMVGAQVAEVVRKHRGLKGKGARVAALELLASVRLDHVDDIYRRYPHELSGGMLQRVSIAAALAGRPELLIADEPTTALDVTTQAGILALLRDLQERYNLAIVFTSHDLGIIAEVCDKVIVMYAGEVVESGDVADVFGRPKHPYTAGLLASDPHAAHGRRRLVELPGTVPEVGNWPTGCHFEPRCVYATEACGESRIAEETVPGGRTVRCREHANLCLRSIT